jgi:hypothetical protein
MSTSKDLHLVRQVFWTIGDNTMRFLLANVLIAYLFVTSAFAESNPPKSAWAGVWKGRIGNLPIIACFNGGRADASYGSYYYERQLVPINLYQRTGDSSASEMVVTWQESDGRGHSSALPDYDGVWQVKMFPPNRIHGTWTNRSKAKELLIELTKLEYAEEAARSVDPMESNDVIRAPCGCDAYNKAIEKTIDTFVSPVRSINRVKYRVIARGLPGRKKHADFIDRRLFVATIELIGDSPIIARINSVLRERISSSEEDMLLECRRKQFSSITYIGEEEYAKSITVSAASHWLVISTDDRINCGESAARSNDTYVWDLSTGRQESLFSLLKGAAEANVTYVLDSAPPEGRLPDALDKMIAEGFRRGNSLTRLGWENIQECYGPYKPGAYQYRLSLAENGITFELPPLPRGACGDEITLTFKELRPFLNKEGSRFAAEILSVRKAKR